MVKRSRDIPFYFQLTANDCAPACVMALADWYGLQVSISELRHRLVTDPTRGTPIKQFLQGLQDLFTVQIGRQSPEQWDETLLPFIAFLPKQAHFVVVWQKTSRTVLLGDPGSG